MRYQLHELVRQYAAEQLAADPAEALAVCRAHSAYYCELLRAGAAGLRGPQQAAVLATLSHEDDNLRAALDWALAQADIAALRAVFPALMAYLESRYAPAEALARCAELTALVEARADPAAPDAAARHALHALALAYAGWFNFYLGQASLALTQLRAAYPLAQAGADPLVLGDTLLFLGFLIAELGDPAEGQRLLERCLIAYEQCGDDWRVGRVYYRLGMVLHQNGFHQRAEAMFRACLARVEALGDARGIGLTLNRLAVMAAQQHRYAEAQDYLQAGLRHCSAINDRRGIASALFHSGSIAQQRADHRAARYFFEESVQVFTELSERYSAAQALAELAYSAATAGDADAAGAALAAAWQLVADAETITVVFVMLVAQGLLDLTAGATVRAVEALTLALRHPVSEQQTRSRAAALLALAQPRLPAPDFAAAQARADEATPAMYLS